MGHGTVVQQTCQKDYINTLHVMWTSADKQLSRFTEVLKSMQRFHLSECRERRPYLREQWKLGLDERWNKRQIRKCEVVPRRPCQHNGCERLLRCWRTAVPCEEARHPSWTRKTKPSQRDVSFSPRHQLVGCIMIPERRAWQVEMGSVIGFVASGT